MFSVKNMMRFGETLRRLRKERDLTQVALAKQIGVSNVYISALERGEKPAPRLEIVVSLAAALSIDESELWNVAKSEREERLVARIQGQTTSARKVRHSGPSGRTGFAAISLEIQRLARRLENLSISKEEEQVLLDGLEGLKQRLSGSGISE